MIILDLFSGLGGWSQAFKDRGHTVYALDIDPYFNTDFCMDIREFKENIHSDIILASPPCEKFSPLQAKKHWNGNTPLTAEAKDSLSLVEELLKQIERLNPPFFIIENPRGKLRNLSVLEHLERRYITYCQYGEPFMKPTDLWGVFPPELILRPPCKKGQNCHFSSQGTGEEWKVNRRGNLTMHKRQHREYYGTSNSKLLSARRAKIPYNLSLEVCIAMEEIVGIRKRVDPEEINRKVSKILRPCVSTASPLDQASA
jgi:hypothetical protein